MDAPGVAIARPVGVGDASRNQQGLVGLHPPTPPPQFKPTLSPRAQDEDVLSRTLLPLAEMVVRPRIPPDVRRMQTADQEVPGGPVPDRVRDHILDLARKSILFVNRFHAGRAL